MIDDEIIYDFLEHHGVLGMKWGRRSGEKSNNTSESNGRNFAGKILRKIGHEVRTHPIVAASIVAGVAYLATPNGRTNLSKTTKEISGRYKTAKVNKLIRAIPKSAYPRDTRKISTKAIDKFRSIKANRTPAFDYGYKLPNVDIGPSGLTSWRFPAEPQ